MEVKPDPATLAQMDSDSDFLSQVKEVIALNQWKMVNTYLQSGWTLLKVLKKRDDEEFCEYVLGWTKEGEPVRHKSRAIW